jgi:hypothetical protein
MSGNSTTKRRLAAPYESDLLAGESLIINYCADVAGCACSPTHEWAGIDCKPVARSSPKQSNGKFLVGAGGVDRCLQCGARWQRRDYRTEPLVMLPGAAA